MTDTTRWQRPNFQPGGGEPFVAFWVFGDLQTELDVSRERHRVRGVPEGVEVHRLALGEKDGDRAFAAFTDPAGSFGERLDKKPELARSVRESRALFRVLGSVEDTGDLLYLRDTIGVVQAMLEVGAVGVLDAAFHWWSAETWARDVFEPDQPRSNEHVTILTSDEDGGLWLHTRGMRLFGRPDLSAVATTDALREPLVELFRRFIAMQVDGAVVSDGQAIRMAGIPPGWVCRHRGDVDDPDFNNVHLEIGPG